MKKQTAKVIKDPLSDSGLSFEFPESFFEELGWDTEKDEIEWVIENGQVKIVNRSKEKEKT